MTLTNPSNLVVVITGCDTGFGAEITQDLYQRGGFTIYATCLTDSAVEKYKALQSSRVRAIQLDVTNQDDINRLRAQVEAECPQGVYCVLNNAGIYGGGFFDFASEDSFQKMMDINYMGIIRISKAMLPSLRIYAKSRHTPQGKRLPKARLLSITSVAGRANPPGHGGYNASKHAAESIMDTLRVELSPWEIDVSMLEPFYAQTPLVSGAHVVLDKVWSSADSTTQRMYGPNFIQGLAKHSEELYKHSMPSKWVVDATINAIRKKNGAHRARILIGFWWVPILIRSQEIFPSWIVDFFTKIIMKRLGTWPADPFLIKDSKGTKEL
ncbi:Retinol dehydrogenase 5 [Entomortierella chlamydospora]|uniref:Retinol dehydrogenase 5 n=1 Tax=Entomortierella chlamydospora TaxID=101097 RepID=A0A9P6N1R7_9FUNG|nr:Retinol dehydrogenase 5 [Entomortierella chlamydospora]KAG0020641.1 Retinol dehydrogenase 5 [Entomortierella chlamydospora]